MIILDSTLKSLEIKLAGAVTTTELPYVLGYVDLKTEDQSVSAVASNDGTTNGGTAVSVLAAPASGHTRQVKSISVSNVDTVAAVVTVQLNDNGTKRAIVVMTLAVGDNLIGRE